VPSYLIALSLFSWVNDEFWIKNKHPPTGRPKRRWIELKAAEKIRYKRFLYNPPQTPPTNSTKGTQTESELLFFFDARWQCRKSW